MQAAATSNALLPFGSPLVALLCLAPLYRAIYAAPTYGRSFILMAAQTLTVHLASSFWLANFHGYATFTLGASALGTAFEGGLCGVIMHALPHAQDERYRLEEAGGGHARGAGARVLWFCAAWIFWEWIKSTGFLAYPWGTLSMAAYRWKLLTQIADVTGVWGVSFLWALASALAGEGADAACRGIRGQRPGTLEAQWRQCAAFAAAAFALCGAYGAAQYLAPREPSKTLNAVIVQQNVDPWEAGDAASIAISKRLTEAEVDAMRGRGQEPDLVLWSEGVLDRPFPNARTYYRSFPEDEGLCAFIARMGVPFIIGGSVRMNAARRRYANSAILFDARGDYAGFYSKMHLVPFAEQIPYADNPLMGAFMRNVVGFASTLTPGAQHVLFTVPLHGTAGALQPLERRLEPYAAITLDAEGHADPASTRRYLPGPAKDNPDTSARFTTPICFEDAFADVCRRLYGMGSEAFLNITNDSWSAVPCAEYQHFIAASYRAIEYRTTLVRCTNAGYSAVVDPAGRVLASLPVFEEGAMGVAVPLYPRAPTVYAALGDWFVWLLLAGMAAFLLAELARLRPLTLYTAAAIMVESSSI